MDGMDPTKRADPKARPFLRAVGYAQNLIRAAATKRRPSAS